MEEEFSADTRGVRVSMFDYSIQNHFAVLDSISKLCEDQETEHLDQNDIQRVSSLVTFLREWRLFSYEPRMVRLANGLSDFQKNDFSVEINLPQFSSVAVGKKEEQVDGTTSSKSCKDFVMYVGGSVWALDWLPRVNENPESLVKCEFIAIAAHPPGSYYHKIGTPLTGRGIIQIWCMLNVGANDEEPPTKKNPKRVYQKVEGTEDGLTQSKKPRGRPRKNAINESLNNEVKRPRGRPRKHPISEGQNFTDSSSQSIHPISVQYPESLHPPLSTEGAPRDAQSNVLRKCHVKKKKLGQEGASISNTATKSSSLSQRSRSKTSCKGSVDDESPLVFDQNEEIGSSAINQPVDPINRQDPMLCGNVVDSGSSQVGLSSSVQEDIVLPRVMFCLAHNGKVAWDVKWQPCNVDDSARKKRLGYLAVLLGDGSLEVWEVPCPRMIKHIYSSSHKVGTDPRFFRLKAVFKCSKLNCGGVKSIPLTVEWSTSPPHDYLLAGCHDGTVALWKFSASNSLEESRPVLCFSADTVPIRSVAWAPAVSDLESGNIILTAGHGCPKFWDIRDPHRPLWDIHSVSRFTYSLDWAPDPKCIIQSFDDGTMRLVSLVKAACDIAVTGKPFAGTKQQGLHNFNCSSFAVWSVQVSRRTGMVAYCGQDGTVKYFQLTSKAVEKDFARNRAPHFLCGSLSEEDSAIIVRTPLSNIPLMVKKPVNDGGEGPRSMRSYLTDNQAKSANSKENNLVSSDDQSLALCYQNDLGAETEMEETLATLKTRKEKTKPGNKNDIGKDKVREIVEMKDEGQGEGKKEREVFPPKIVAIHRVRWNMNKGSERWLCYGGAAGIVRCQEIKPLYFDKKSARNNNM